MKKKIIISACLSGVKCTYKGGCNLSSKIAQLVKDGIAIPVCPEQLGGLPTPRIPAEIITGETDLKVIDKNGKDVTENFKQGAEQALKIAQMVGATQAILKARSPSCGLGKVYDGTHSRKLKEGNGVTADLFIKNGITVYTEENFLDKIKLDDK